VWWASILPNLGFLGLSVLELCRGTPQTDRQMDRRADNRGQFIMLPPLWGGGIIITTWHVKYFNSRPSYNCLLRAVVQLESTHRVQTHAVLMLTLTLMLTFDLSTQNHVICRISEGLSLYQVWTLLDHSFLNYAADKQTGKQIDSKILYPCRPT